MNHYRWILVAHISELRNVGDFVKIPFWRSHILVQRMDDRELVAWDGSCPHRGTQLHPGVHQGNRAPRCNYHGRCAKTGQIKARMALCIANGWVFVDPTHNHIGNGRYDGVLPVFAPEFDLPLDLRHFGSVSYRINCHWMVAVENALDTEHVPHVHAGSLNALGIKSRRLDLMPGGSSVEAFEATAMKERLDQLQRFFKNVHSFDYVHQHFHPYSALSSTRGFTFSLQNYMPLTDGTTWFFHRMYTAPTVRAYDLQSFFESAFAMNKQVFEEDAEICSITPHSRSIVDLEPHEKRIGWFRAAANSDGGRI